MRSLRSSTARSWIVRRDTVFDERAKSQRALWSRERGRDEMRSFLHDRFRIRSEDTMQNEPDVEDDSDAVDESSLAGLSEYSATGGGGNPPHFPQMVATHEV